MSKFKVGDKVRIISDVNITAFSKIGDVVVIDQNDSSCPFFLYENGERGCGNESDLELTTSEGKFKIGDTVFINNNDTNYEADFCSWSGWIKHGTAPVCPQKGEVMQTSPTRLLIKYLIGSKEMVLSFRKVDCSIVEEEILKSTDEIIEIINNDLAQVNKESIKNMDLLKKFADALMGEPEKSLMKYGVTDSQGNLTSGGTALYINWKFKQDLEAFQKDVLAVLIKADKKSKKDEE